jgi:tetratricopeptide (TPR) repeat protein
MAQNIKGMKAFFASFFGEEPKPPQERRPAAPLPRKGPRQTEIQLYKKGDVIGRQYEVYRTLGKGGFGIVYLAYDRDCKEVCALKTFRDELLADARAREAFKKEALLWVNLDQHPFIVAARFVTEISGRLFVKMDHVAPDPHGRASLADHLARAGAQPLDTDQTVKWAIQFCLGMEHAQARGIKCHRDIKPANILITQDGTLKISDFGLAAAAEVAWQMTGADDGPPVAMGVEGSFGLSLMRTEGKARCGTPGYMAPEVYRAEGAGPRSDIYSFGLVLWQMAKGSPTPPFVVPYRGHMEGYLREIYEQQISGRVPGVEGVLGTVIERCLRLEAGERYGGFGEVRRDLEPAWERRTGKKFEMPPVGEKTTAFWINKGCSLYALGRHEEAIACHDRALAIDSGCTSAWCSKAGSVNALGRRAEAIECCDRALAIDARDAVAWNNKGLALCKLGRRKEGMECYERALAIDPRDPLTWNNKGNGLDELGRREEAIECYDRALAVDQRYAMVWCNKSISLYSLGRYEEVVFSANRAVASDPRHVGAWNMKGLALNKLGAHEEALTCYDQALDIDERYAIAWHNKGLTLVDLGRREEAIECYDQALAIDPQAAGAWCDKAASLERLERRVEALTCYDRALAIDSGNALAWSGKGIALCKLGRRKEGMECHERALAIDPRNPSTWINKGIELAELGRLEDAIACYNKALSIDPGQALAWYNKANALYHLGRRAEANACFDKTLAIDPGCLQAWNNKGATLESLGRREEALICYDRVLLIDPQDAKALQNKRHLRRR